jgi:glycosyltransferase involved in cell wall biosynthesis
MGFTSNPNLLIYRDELLGASETFVLSQAEALQQFRPVYVGLRLVPELPTPADRRVLLASSGVLGKPERARRRLFGPTKSQIRQLRDLNPVLVHAHFGPDGIHATPIAKQLEVPLIVTFHGYDATMSDEALSSFSMSLRSYVRRRPELIANASLSLCVSEFIRQKLLERGFPAEKTRVHYVGVDTEVFRADPSVERRKLVLFVGRLVENKGCEFLLRAMKTVQQSHPDAELAIIGEGPLRSALEHRAHELQLSNFRFLGMQPLSIVRQWMNQARVFSVPSIEVASGASEGFGLVFAEAQSMGVPVVSFRTGGIPEAVADGCSGLLAPPANWEMLAEHIELLFSSSDVWDCFSTEASNRARRCFSLAKQTASLEQIYNEVIAGKQPGTTLARDAAYA